MDGLFHTRVPNSRSSSSVVYHAGWTIQPSAGLDIWFWYTATSGGLCGAFDYDTGAQTHTITTQRKRQM